MTDSAAGGWNSCIAIAMLANDPPPRDQQIWAAILGAILLEHDPAALSRVLS
jgi:hypothetical protein